jgi:hypothetical protein
MMILPELAGLSLMLSYSIIEMRQSVGFNLIFADEKIGMRRWKQFEEFLLVHTKSSKETYFCATVNAPDLSA